MGHTLMLEIPENIYQPLAKTAEQRGGTPEELAIEWLFTASHLVVDDPVENFIGVFQSNISDWTEQHDKYIGQTLMSQMQNKGGTRQLI